MVSLTKTFITQLNNCYIDGSYSKRGTTEVVNIEIPDPNGHELKNNLFTIRTKDGYALKYDETSGKVVYRFPTKLLDYEMTLSQVIGGYSSYFNEYTFKLSDLSSYKNDDPVTEYKTPLYAKKPIFEYSDIEVQKENIYIINTGIIAENGKTKVPVFIVSYYGRDPKRCKLKIINEVFNTSNYEIKTKSGRMFSDYKIIPEYGASIDSGTTISSLVSIIANAEKVGEVIEEDTTDGLFTTYVVNQNDLKTIADTGKIYSEIIINTFSYPIKFDETELIETNIVLGNTPLSDTKGKRFKRAEPRLKIFSFKVPYLKDVESCKLLLPFNPEIILDYDIIRGKKINGFIQYEVSTNSSTLYIDNEDVEFYKDTIVIETVVPFKPTGEYSNFKETEKRLGKQTPTLLIKCLQEEKQSQFIQGIIEYPIGGILKDELSLLNTELQKGVITNE